MSDFSPVERVISAKSETERKREALLTGGDYSLETSAKIETLLEQIQSKAPHHKILVFSQFVTMLERQETIYPQK